MTVLCGLDKCVTVLCGLYKCVTVLCGLYKCMTTVWTVQVYDYCVDCTSV